MARISVMERRFRMGLAGSADVWLGGEDDFSFRRTDLSSSMPNLSWTDEILVGGSAGA